MSLLTPKNKTNMENREQTHYYLIEGKIMKGTLMPKEPEHKNKV